ncbi:MULTISPECIES: hemerythrin domain-containing protein [unclassified Sphingomonas]|uniref:hemerythrin domain-containing protein n=1 Tax=unclassified Sphingomonas TaxID=196159 RepID=UPI002151A5B7|nr:MULTISPECIES: hemerythrin domain-containing protein [unclassified Sphingomonas]MCR5870779.1 hemerythrin domain-containing protein [Sphingomonas sp. J344]UUY00887.1 hemerythrin domain-containing protein [Sphingomonas sp. J315]
MVSIERLIDEHARITAMANALMRDAANASGAELHAAIVALDTELAAHLATEDLDVYPHLLSAGDLAQREAAEIAMGDFEKLAAQWRAYVSDWTAEEIEGDRELFVEASKRMLSALAARVRIENEILYPLALACGTITLREASARMMAR